VVTKVDPDGCHTRELRHAPVTIPCRSRRRESNRSDSSHRFVDAGEETPSRRRVTGPCPVLVGRVSVGPTKSSARPGVPLSAENPLDHLPRALTLVHPPSCCEVMSLESRPSETN
jgi:hypothetical protein